MRIVAGIIAALSGAFWLLCGYRVLESRFATDPAVDPHGYALIFGAVLSLPAGLVCALALPARARRIALPVYAVVSVLLLAGWFTA
ncbi:hypothetical protein [Nocardia asteroides]|uniref:hypothetical protein n=1 Tax=Nocardia asteroides TaxID=1824 RepID=UPI001E4C64FA|nr:hypothetical protein [Nocardia asteroides]UGT61606.1 hypothetical protein LTT61_31610 [Nocardia asteroides]